MTWKIFFIMWISWAWKWTLIRNLKNLNDDRFIFPLSYRSRQIRETEKNWVDSWFVTKEEFEKSIKAWEFLEYGQPYGLSDYYWTKFVDVIENWVDKWKIVIKEIEMNWLLSLEQNKPELKKYYKTIFLTVPFNVQADRIKARWVFMSDLELEKRKITAIGELEKAKNHCDYIIDTSAKAKEEVLSETLKLIKNNI